MEIATCLEPVGVQLEGGDWSSHTVTSPTYVKSIRPPRTANSRRVDGYIPAECVYQSADSFLLNSCVFCGNDEHSHPNYKTKKIS